MYNKKEKACFRNLGRIFYQMSKETIVSVQQFGIFTILAIVIIFTACDNSSSVSSDPDVIGQVIITPDSASLEVGETLQFTATVYDQNGQVMHGETVTWISNNGNVAEVDENGLATALFEGTANILVSASGQASDIAQLNVINLVSGSWQPVGSGMNDDVRAFTEFEGDLVAGGWFTTAGGETANRVARWDGSEWLSIGSVGDPDNWQASVHTLTVFDGDLIAGGGFITADGQTVNNIARWDGSNWQSMGDGMDNAVLGLTVFEDDLIAVGTFRHAGGEQAQYVARWNGTEWQPMASGMNGSVSAVEVFGSDLIIGGVFKSIGGQAATRVARWDGTGWQPMGTVGDPDDSNEWVLALTVFDNELIVGGRFETTDGREVNNVARWDGSGWQPLDTGTSREVQTLTTFDGDLIAGGHFITASGIEVRRTARWDGSRWQPMGPGIGSPHTGLSSVDALIVHDDNLFVGGEFTSTGSGKSANNVARWGKP